MDDLTKSMISSIVRKLVMLGAGAAGVKLADDTATSIVVGVSTLIIVGVDTWVSKRARQKMLEKTP